MQPKAFRRYCVICLGVIVPFLGLGILNVICLLRAYEIATYDEIVEKQLEKGGLYGSTLHGNDLKYKLALVRKTKPQVMVIGSSRAMNFRQVGFVKKFVNAGGVFSTIREGETFVSEMLKHHRPESVILVVDYWWFHPQTDHESNRFDNSDEKLLTFERITYPVQWIASGKIPLGLYWDVVTQGRYTNTFTNFDNLGFFALTYSSGFRVDGSYLNAKAMYASRTDYRSWLFEEVKSIGQGNFERANYGYGKFVDPKILERFAMILRKLRGDGVRVSVVLPPVMPLFYDAIVKAKREAYVSDLAEKLKLLSPEFHDFTAFPEAKAPNCEYIDGFHMGDILSLRLLNEMSKRDSQAAPYFDLPQIQKTISQHAGKTLLPLEEGIYKLAEEDYLHLGCRQSGEKVTHLITSKF